MPRSTIEHKIQAGIIKWARQPAIIRVYPGLELLHAIPNARKSTVVQGAWLKAEGVLAGVWDLALPVPIFRMASDWDHGLIMEVKDPKYRTHKDGGLTPEQVWYGDTMREHGTATEVVYTTMEGIDAILQYLA
jgi:hypothetical protein